MLLSHPSAEEVARGLLRQEFRLYLQPKFDLLSGAVFAVEALARWHHPIHGVLTPGAFLPTLEKHHWLDALFFQLLEQGLRCQWQLHQLNVELGFSFNVSPTQLLNSDWSERLQQRLQQHPLPASSVTLEITEGALAQSADSVCTQLMRLKGLGLRLSMDDFGTGHSSLLRLCQLPFNEIKLAGEFLRDLSLNPQHQAIIESTLGLATQLGLSLVVEGIETQEQRQWLALRGVSLGQGYLCARPMPVEALLGWVKTPALMPLRHKGPSTR